MARVARLIIYNFEDPIELDAQLGRSMNEGTRKFGAGKEISVVNIPDAFFVALTRWTQEAEKRLDDAPALPQDYQAAQV